MKHYCNLLTKMIQEGKCVDINYENEKIMKEDVLIVVSNHITNP